MTLTLDDHQIRQLNLLVELAMEDLHEVHNWCCSPEALISQVSGLDERPGRVQLALAAQSLGRLVVGEMQ